MKVVTEAAIEVVIEAAINAVTEAAINASTEAEINAVIAAVRTDKGFVEQNVISEDGGLHRSDAIFVAVSERCLQRCASPSQLERLIDFFALGVEPGCALTVWYTAETNVPCARL